MISCGEEECVLPRILHNVVCVAVSFPGGGFSTSGKSSPLYQVYIQGVYWDKIPLYPRLVGSRTYVQTPLVLISFSWYNGLLYRINRIGQLGSMCSYVDTGR
jgi:hypothetical protein